MGTDTVEFSTRQVKDIRDEDGQPMADKEADHSTVKLVAELDWVSTMTDSAGEIESAAATSKE